MKYNSVYLISSILLLFVCLLSEIQVCHTKGIDLSICDDARINCQCGPPPGYTFQILVKQCTYFYRWEASCKPCKGVKQEELCNPYKTCRDCRADANQCITCPNGKYGLWCTGDCKCSNGATCNRLDGSCQCAPGFTGQFCEIKHVSECSPPESVTNIKWMGNSYKVGDIVTAQCPANYTLMGNKLRKCEQNGTWSGTVPTCEVICRFPTLGPHLKTIVNPSLPTKLLDSDNKEVVKEIEFVCDGGYTLTGPHRVICGADGEWDQKPPQCRPKIVCNEPGNLTNGKRSVSEDVDGMFAPGTQIKLSCNKGYFIDGSETITCTTTGKWSSSMPQCLKVTGCPIPATLKNGKVEITKPVPTLRALGVVSRIGIPPKKSTTLAPTAASVVDKLPDGYSNINSRALYSCNSVYYRLQGPSSRICLENGKWSGQDPTCEVICGQSSDPKRPSIINGTISNIGKWPWQAAISLWKPQYNESEMSCGGSLISENYVLTAAHCVIIKGSSRPLPLNDIRVYLGKHFRYDDMDDKEVRAMKVATVLVHPNFHPKSLDSDLALLKLSRPVEINSRIQPVCLPEVKDRSWVADLPEGLVGTVTGWGIINDGFPADELFEAELPVVNRTNCEDGYQSVNLSVTLTTNMFCAGLEEGGRGTCSGDSGGPFVVQQGSATNKKWILEGVISWGGSKVCAAAKQYSGFLKLANFVDWIYSFL